MTKHLCPEKLLCERDFDEYFVKMKMGNLYDLQKISKMREKT